MSNKNFAEEFQQSLTEDQFRASGSNDLPFRSNGLAPNAENLPEKGLRQRLTDGAVDTLKQAGVFTMRTARVPSAFIPLAQLLAHNQPVTESQFGRVVDQLFDTLYDHPITRSTQKLTSYLRKSDFLPNESTTEDLIRYIVNQCVQRSPVAVPDQIISEFWSFFDELMRTPELKGLAEVNLDVSRYVLRTYEPLLVELINVLKETRRVNASMLNELGRRASVIRYDLDIIRRQVKALRYIKPFFQTDPQDFATQARIVADMVREFGPFFVKMAQVAASNADFLPDEISKELQVFHEEVDPMSPDEVLQAFDESLGCHPSDLYYGFDPAKPLRSGSIGSVYLARKPVMENDVEVLRPVIVKVGRHNLDREFMMGKMVIGLAIMSSQYWAPHSRLAPFLQAMQEQVDEFVKGFQAELNFIDEARIQRRFHNISKQTSSWKVPEIYNASERVLEMEYLENTESLGRAADMYKGKTKRKFQRRIGRTLIYTLLEQVLVHREFHGDLHPGNIMVSPGGQLYLIDWGNVVSLDGKWQDLRDYLVGIITADAVLVADVLIRVSTDPKKNRTRRQDIIDTLDDTLQRKGVAKLGRNWPITLKREGMAGLQTRLQAAMQLMSNTQSLGMVVSSEYLHLSRSLFAAAGSLGSLYNDAGPVRLAMDLIRGAGLFPLQYAREDLVQTNKKRISRLKKFVGAS